MLMNITQNVKVLFLTNLFLMSFHPYLEKKIKILLSATLNTENKYISCVEK